MRISLRTLSDVPAEGNGHQTKPKTWHAEGSTKHSDRYAILLRLIETGWKLRAEADGYDLSPLLRVMVLLPVGEGSDMGGTPSSTMYNTHVLG